MKPTDLGVTPRTAHVHEREDDRQAEEKWKEFHGADRSCIAVSSMLQRIGDKWTVLVVSYLGNGPMRFNELRKGIGNISQKMLTTTLRNLERDGMVTRTVTPTRPPSVEYELTQIGHCLLVPVSSLARWALENLERIESARAEYDAKNGT